MTVSRALRHGRDEVLTFQSASLASSTSRRRLVAKMNAHPRFALPMNTHSNLKYLNGKAQAHADSPTTTAKPRRDSSASKLAWKMQTLFSGKNAKAAASTPEQEAAANERKRSTISRFIGSRAFEQMGRR
ncbi:hypothetical protein PF001_g9164 [Phytophthora fragariae]|uniref:Uncharacterized protein n=1 Tax=Phytophthora fragariae TaxID=53985 RepID=A0A6A4DQH8_9STRA|nr:hypothetical protein PF001_g9164 [Phytophthora fragariae]